MDIFYWHHGLTSCVYLKPPVNYADFVVFSDMLVYVIDIGT